MTVQETWEKGFPHHPQEFEDWGAEVSEKADDTEDHKASSTDVHGIPDTAELETKTGAQEKANIARDEAIAVADQGSTALDAHINTTTDVHGIPDTALLETQAGAQEKANIARDEAIAVADQGSTALDNHIGTTTNVHGIANTADLETKAGAQEKVDTGLNSINISAGTTTTGAPGTDANVTKTGSKFSPTFNFVIPRGDQGEKGDTGDAATIDVGSVTTGDPGTDVDVQNVGTTGAAILDFAIPRGEQGIQGPQGIQGIQGEKGDKGDKGDTGHGVIAGGGEGDLLAKASANDFDTVWVDSDTFVKSSTVGEPDGIATLDSAGKVTASQLPDNVITWGD